MRWSGRRGGDGGVPSAWRPSNSLIDPFHQRPKVTGGTGEDEPWRRIGGGSAYAQGGQDGMSTEDLEKYETEMELQLYREYRDIVRQFSYVVETERRFYLANQVELHVRNVDGEVYFEVEMHDAWVWDMYRPARFVKNVRVMTFKDVNA